MNSSVSDRQDEHAGQDQRQQPAGVGRAAVAVPVHRAHQLRHEHRVQRAADDQDVEHVRQVQADGVGVRDAGGADRGHQQELPDQAGQRGRPACPGPSAARRGRRWARPGPAGGPRWRAIADALLPRGALAGAGSGAGRAAGPARGRALHPAATWWYQGFEVAGVRAARRDRHRRDRREVPAGGADRVLVVVAPVALVVVLVGGRAVLVPLRRLPRRRLRVAAAAARDLVAEQRAVVLAGAAAVARLVAAGGRARLPGVGLRPARIGAVRRRAAELLGAPRDLARVGRRRGSGWRPCGGPAYCCGFRGSGRCSGRCSGRRSGRCPRPGAPRFGYCSPAALRRAAGLARIAGVRVPAAAIRVLRAGVLLAVAGLLGRAGLSRARAIGAAAGSAAGSAAGGAPGSAAGSGAGSPGVRRLRRSALAGARVRGQRPTGLRVEAGLGPAASTAAGGCCGARRRDPGRDEDHRPAVRRTGPVARAGAAGHRLRAADPDATDHCRRSSSLQRSPRPWCLSSDHCRCFSLPLCPVRGRVGRAWRGRRAIRSTDQQHSRADHQAQGDDADAADLHRDVDLTACSASAGVNKSVG